MAALISASPTVTTRAAPRLMAVTAAGSGTRQAMPSARVSAALVETASPRAKDRA